MKKTNYKKTLGLISSFVLTATLLSGCSMEEFFNGEKAQAESIGSVSYGHELDPEVHELITDSEYRMINEDEEALFETMLTDEDVALGADTALYSYEGIRLSDMYDDGTHGDRIAGDNIYSCLYDVSSQSGEEQMYKVKIGDTETNPIKFTYFDDITDEEYEYAENVPQMLDKAIEKYKVDGVVTDEDKAYEEILNVAQELVDNGEAIDYDAYEEGKSIIINMKSGIGCYYQIETPGTDGANQADSIEVYTYQPCESGYDDNMSRYMKYPDAAGERISEEFDNVSFTNNYDNASVTTEIVKNFSSDQIILWHGHGGYTEESHSLIVCGEQAGADYKNDEDYIKRRIYVFSDNSIGFSYKYIDYYCGDLSNTLVYMGCCSTAKDTVLAASFLNKGAELFIGNDETIRTVYNLSMIKRFSEGLSKQKKEWIFFNAGYRTAKEALEYAKDKEGEYSPGEEKAKVVMYGNLSYKLGESEKESEETVSGTKKNIIKGDIQISNSYSSISLAKASNGDTYKIDIVKLPEGYTKEDIIWSSSNSNTATVSDGEITPLSEGNVVVELRTKDNKYVQYCSVKITE